MTSKNLVKSKARVKQLGEVFTPSELVNEMLDKLPPECWLPGKTFFEPSCGTGNFLVAILERKLRLGHPPLGALSTLWGVDIMVDNVVESRKRMLQTAIDGGLSIKSIDLQEAVKILRQNVRVGNTLEQSLEEIFEERK